MAAIQEGDRDTPGDPATGPAIGDKPKNHKTDSAVRGPETKRRPDSM